MARSSDAKDRIVRTLAELLKSKPIEQITVKELINKSHVSRGGFYYHFYGIEEVCECIMDRFLSKMKEQFVLSESLVNDGPLSPFGQSCEACLAFILDNRDLYLAITKSGLRNRFFSKIQAFLLDSYAQHEHFFERDGEYVRLSQRDAGYYDAMVVGAFLATLQHWEERHFQEGSTELTELAFDLNPPRYSVLFK